MNIEMLKKYKDYTKPLTQNDRKRLLSFKENQNELIDYMLKNNVKLEQEIIGENENERKTLTRIRKFTEDRHWESFIHLLILLNLFQ
ncbi:MAG: hypothetical protein ACLR43_02715 [Faecalibacillus faecis]